MTRIVTEQADDPWLFSADRFVYASNGQALTYLLRETWVDVPESSCPVSYAIENAWEFRYDAARERYLSRQLSPWGLMQDPIEYTPLIETWSDYDNDVLYGNWRVYGSGTIGTLSYAPGLAKTVNPVLGTPSTDYYHTDLIGTTRSMSDASGAAQEPGEYTAFGEPVNGLDPRLGYAGAWGYQSNDELTYLHVGARYYDSATGRFLQRDPIGIVDGSNVYAYVRNSPQVFVDPSGLNVVGDFLEGAGVVIGGVAGAMYLSPNPGVKIASGGVGAIGAIVCAVGVLINAITSPPLPTKTRPARPGPPPRPRPIMGPGFGFVPSPGSGT